MPWAEIEAFEAGVFVGVFLRTPRMAIGGKFSEPPIHLLCRRLGYAFREYKAVVGPGDPFLSFHAAS